MIMSFAFMLAAMRGVYVCLKAWVTAVAAIMHDYLETSSLCWPPSFSAAAASDGGELKLVFSMRAKLYPLQTMHAALFPSALAFEPHCR